MRFDGKVILVTGGNGGIGFATAKRLISENATVVITGTNEEKLEKAALELGPRSLGIRTDVSEMGELDRLYTTIEEKYGQIDGLFANAGYGAISPIPQMTEEFYDALMGVNAKGLFFSIQKAIPLLKDGASVVITGSGAATRGEEGLSIYAASKAAASSMARSFSRELLGRKIRVNTLIPGPIETPFYEELPEDQRLVFLERLSANVPLQRMGRPDEVAGAAAFLLSADSVFMLGSEVHVDGGRNQL